MQAIRLKCKCGKILRVSTELAGKKVSCPACRTTYRVPVAKAAAAPVELKTVSPHAVVQTASSSSDLDLTATAVAATPSELDLLSEIELIPSAPVCPSCKKQLPNGAKICVNCGVNLATGERIVSADQVASPVLGYAQDHHRGGGRSKRDVIGEPVRSYWADSLQSFIYPFKSVNNVMTLAIVMGVASLRVFLNFSIFGSIGKFIIGGWMAAVYLSVVTHTAMGVEEMPGVKMEDGPWDDIIKPAFRFVGAYFFALAPTAVFVILLASGVLPAFMQSGEALLLWLAGGIFVWPMLVMLFAFEEWKQAYRIDLIITTISRAFLPYLSLWLILLVVGSISMLPYAKPLMDQLGIDLNVSFFTAAGLVTAIVLEAVNVYLTVVSMRQIGLYYLHFKNRFTFSFE